MEILLIIFILYTIFGRKKDEKKKKKEEKKEGFFEWRARTTKEFWDDASRWEGTR